MGGRQVIMHMIINGSFPCLRHTVTYLPWRRGFLEREDPRSILSPSFAIGRPRWLYAVDGPFRRTRLDSESCKPEMEESVLV